MDYNETFEEWIDRLYEILTHKGYTGNFDRESFRSDFENGSDAYEIADSFLEEINEE